MYFLLRIYLFELDSSTSLHTIVAFNENVLEEVRQLQKLENCQRDTINLGISYLFKNILMMLSKFNKRYYKSKI